MFSYRIDTVLQQIRSEYLSVPGLALTASEAAVLAHSDTHLSQALLDALVDARFLARAPNGVYVLSSSLRDDMTATSPPRTPPDPRP